MVELKKNEIAFLERGFEKSLGETKSLFAQFLVFVRFRYFLRALTGHRSSSDGSSVSEAKD